MFYLGSRLIYHPVQHWNYLESDLELQNHLQNPESSKNSEDQREGSFKPTEGLFLGPELALIHSQAVAISDTPVIHEHRVTPRPNTKHHSSGL